MLSKAGLELLMHSSVWECEKKMSTLPRSNNDAVSSILWFPYKKESVGPDLEIILCYLKSFRFHSLLTPEELLAWAKADFLAAEKQEQGSNKMEAFI